MIRGASHLIVIAARRGVLASLVAFSVLMTGEVSPLGHHACHGHAEPRGDATELVSSCLICDFEAARPANARPSPLRGTLTPLPLATPLAAERETDGFYGVRLAGLAAPRAPPAHS